MNPCVNDTADDLVSKSATLTAGVTHATHTVASDANATENVTAITAEKTLTGDN